MLESKFQRDTSESDPDRMLDQVGRLIACISGIADRRIGVAECRTEIMSLLTELTGAASGIWMWGISNETATSIAPIATVQIGMSESEATAVKKMGLDPTMTQEFREPIMNRMNGRLQSTDLRTDLYDAKQWKAKQMRANLSAGGFDEWLHSVRYSRSESWSSILLLRQTGSPPFQPEDQQLIDLAMGNIPWLSSTLDVSLPAEACTALTSRQRLVLMMQLDGLSRKQIASHLQITVDTVGDHMKQIYEHFGVNSAGELAAIFLRER